MAADALAVVGIHVTAGGGFALLDAEHSVLRTVDNAVVTLEAHAAAHAAVGFLDSLLVTKAVHAFFKVAQHLFRVWHVFATQYTLGVSKVAKEQFLWKEK